MKYWVVILAILQLILSGLEIDACAAAETKRSAIEIQQALSSKGFDIGKVDGKWGVRSEKALQAFQKSVGLEPTGESDSQTLRKLFPAKPVGAVEPLKANTEIPSPPFDTATIDVITIYRLAKTGIDTCQPIGLDLAKIEAGLRSRLGDRYDIVIDGVAYFGNRERSGVDYLDASFGRTSCATWTLIASASGYMLEHPVANSQPIALAPSKALPLTDGIGQTGSVSPKTDSAPSASTHKVLDSPSTAMNPRLPFLFGGIGAIALFGFWIFLGWRKVAREKARATGSARALGSNIKPNSMPPHMPPLPAAAKLANAKVKANLLAARKARYDQTISETAERIAHERAPVERDQPTIVVIPLMVAEEAKTRSAEGSLPTAPVIPDIHPPANPTSSPYLNDGRPPLATGTQANDFLSPKQNAGIEDWLANLRPAGGHSSGSTMPVSAGSAPVEAAKQLATPIRPHLPDQPTTTVKAQSDNREAVWVQAGKAIKVGAIAITGGLFYLGRRLREVNYASGKENCLIDPSLQIAVRGDFTSQLLNYYPSYSDLTPSSRKAFLDWLAGPRSDPSLPIGYVFIYFYGLERRLMLDPQLDDRGTITTEIERLLAVYGHDHSFKRYATDLLAAEKFRTDAFAEHLEFRIEDYDTADPRQLLASIGQRVRDEVPIEADLLLAFAMTQTNVSKTAKRALPVLRTLFADAIVAKFKKGLIVSKSSRAKELELTYRSASGTFTVDLLPPNHRLLDVSGLPKPLGSLQTILLDCNAQLHAYCKELSRSPGMSPTLSAVSKLPLEIRRSHAAYLDDNPLGFLDALAESGSPISCERFAAWLGFAFPEPMNRSRLREWSDIAAAFGYGLTIDPAFAVRLPKVDDPLVIFLLQNPLEAIAPPSEAFRVAQLSTGLATMVALADGHIDPAEEQALFEMARAAEGVDADERRRLIAEIRSGSIAQLGPVDLKSRIKAATPDVRTRLGEVIVAMASADGSVDPREVGLLEKLFRQMDLDTATLYSKLHATAPVSTENTRYRSVDSPVLIVREGSDSSKTLPEASDKLGEDRLSVIRLDTLKVRDLLATVFVDEEDEPHSQPVTVLPSSVEELSGRFPGLTARQQALIDALVGKSAWPRLEFDGLARHFELMPGAAIEVINSWAFDQFDEPLLEGDDPVVFNLQLLSDASVSVSA